MLKITQFLGDVPRDVIAFCNLIARILYRCLKNQEAHKQLFPILEQPGWAKDSQQG